MRNEEAREVPNVWRQWRAQRSGASPLHAGVRPQATAMGWRLG